MILALLAFAASAAPLELVVQTGHAVPVLSLAAIPDGRLAVTGDLEGVIKLWTLPGGRELRSMNHASEISSVAISWDGRHVLSGGAKDDTARLWDAVTGRSLGALPFDDTVRAVAFAPDGGQAAIASERAVRIVSVPDLTTVRELPTTEDAYAVAYSPDGATIAVGTQGFVDLWAVDGEGRRHHVDVDGIVSHMAFSADGRRVAVGAGREVHLLDESGGISWSVDFPDNARTVGWTSDGARIVVGGDDRRISFHDPTTGREVRGIDDAHAHAVSRLATTPYGGVLSASYSGEVRLWDASSGTRRAELSGRASAIRVTALSNDGRVFTAGAGATILPWDLATGRPQRALDTRWPSQEERSKRVTWVEALAVSADGTRLAVGTNRDPVVQVVRARDGKVLHQLEGHKAHVTAVTFLANGGLVSVSRDGTARTWSADGAPGQTLTADDDLRSVAVSPDGATLAAGTDGGKVALWDLTTGAAKKPLYTDWNRAIVDVAFSPDGRFVAAAGGFRVRLDDPSETERYGVSLVPLDGGRRIALDGHLAGCRAVAFSPDGAVIASGGDDARVLLWSADGRQLRALEGHTGPITDLRFTADGSTLLSSALDATVRLWRPEDGALVATRVEAGGDWVVVTPEGRFDGTDDGLKAVHYARGLAVQPVDSFFEALYTPGLLAHVVSAQPLPPPPITVPEAPPPPVVTLALDPPGPVIDAAEVTVTITATDGGGGIDELRLFHNGKRVGEDTRGFAVVPKAGEARAFRIALAPGENRFTAVALDEARTESAPVHAVITRTAPVPRADLHVLAIGINAYRNGVYDLNYGRPDAEAIVAALQRHGAPIFEEIHVTAVYDRDATGERLRAALEEIAGAAAPEDVVVVYYAGHGVMSEPEGDQAARFYLVPSDVVKMSDNAQLASLGISADALAAWSTRVPARKLVLMLDACQSGGAVQAFAMRGAAEEKAVKQLARASGIAVLAAAGTEQFATELQALGHGVFTYALLKGLEGRADGGDRDRKITVKELEAYLGDVIPELTEQHRGQAQWPNAFALGQDFPLGVVPER